MVDANPGAGCRVLDITSDRAPKWLLRKKTANWPGCSAWCSSVSPWYVSWLVLRKSCRGET